MSNDIVMDLETYCNIFTAGFKLPGTDTRYLFEISWRKNEINDLLGFLGWLRANGYRVVTFNGVNFDYPVTHFIIENRPTVEQIYQKAMSIIKSDDKFGHIIWERDRYLPQIDLYKIHHFDNKARATSLKALEFAMRMESVEDLPFKPGSFLTWSQCDTLIDYMWHDIDATEMFYHQSREQIAFREQLSAQLGVDMLNHNDTKIGKSYFILELEKAGVPCYANRKPRQTPRPFIRLGDVILPYVQFQRPEFQRVLDYLRGTTITDIKAAPQLKDLHATIDGFRFDFGTGGIHGAEENASFRSSDTHMILDIDVSSYYPNLSISNRFFPAHLSEKFCDIYQAIYERRKQTKKGSTENAMLKLALNGTYGASGDPYSPFFDPQFTMSITINGQLLLCMLAEKLIANPSVTLVSCNTDGVCLYFPRSEETYVRDVCDWWQDLTKLVLEDVEYAVVFGRDVNNYLAQTVDGKVKRKGAYDHELAWHQDPSALVIPKAAEAFLLHGTPIRSFIENHTDLYDFMLRGRATGQSRLTLVDYAGTVTDAGKLCRYFVSPTGYDLVKVMPPLKGQSEWRNISLCAGWKVRLANRMDTVNPDDVDHDYYVECAEKLVAPFRRIR